MFTHTIRWGEPGAALTRTGWLLLMFWAETYPEIGMGYDFVIRETLAYLVR